MSEGQPGKVGGDKVQRVGDVLRARLADGTYPLGSRFPTQRELVEEFGVSRDTVQRVLNELAGEGWTASRQGSGTWVVMKTQRIHSSAPKGGRPGSLTLGPLIGAAFESPQVTLDVFTLTSESLDTHIRVQSERIRAEEIAPETISVRMLLPSESLALPYPRSLDDPADPRLRERLRAITRRHTESLREVLGALETEELVESVRLTIRHVRLTPFCKLYILNGVEALHGPYEAVERTIALDGGDRVRALDVIGLGSTLTHYVADDDQDAQGSVFVGSMQAAFNSWWDLLADE
ncbi:winged helix-turn-helix domain-containing protein [Streptomyces sp. NPDC091292]|uniref:winged helix-turn-helix domain-containing protein n=1 Tax=Streptomyces sp. NPDC091292 TaxID=3365991 RepID=UPI0037FB98D5